MRSVFVGAVGSMVLSLFALAGCASKSGGGSGEEDACVPNETASCVGPSGCSGVQVCKADGTAFSNCACIGSGDLPGSGGSPGGGGSPGSGASSGSGGSGGNVCTETSSECTTNGECCNYQAGHGFCVSYATSTVCADSCVQDSDCKSGCCAELDNGKKACGPASACTTAGIGDPCDSDADCAEGACNGSWCTTTCSTNVDCGFNSAGQFNWCMNTDAGSAMCFSGCSSASCAAYPGSSCQTYTATNGAAAKICSF